MCFQQRDAKSWKINMIWITGNPFVVHISQWFSAQRSLPITPREVWQCLESFMIVTPGGHIVEAIKLADAIL